MVRDYEDQIMAFPQEHQRRIRLNRLLFKSPSLLCLMMMKSIFSGRVMQVKP